jgi:hypothetical protein
MYIEVQNTKWLYLMMHTSCIKYKQLLPPYFQEAHYTTLTTEINEHIFLLTAQIMNNNKDKEIYSISSNFNNIVKKAKLY